MPSLDLNNPEFQRQLFDLEKQERHLVLNTLGRLLGMDWETVYKHSGLNWEQIHSLSGPQGQILYSLRVTQKMRAVAWREGEVLRLLSLHADHDSAYQ